MTESSFKWIGDLLQKLNAPKLELVTFCCYAGNIPELLGLFGIREYWKKIERAVIGRFPSESMKVVVLNLSMGCEFGERERDRFEQMARVHIPNFGNRLFIQWREFRCFHGIVHSSD